METKSAVCYSLTLKYQEVMAYIRIIGPYQSAGINIIPGIEDDKSVSQRVKDGDFVVVQREFPRKIKAYKSVVDTAKIEDKPLVFDMDDLLFYLPENHPDRGGEYYPSSLLPMFQAVLEADMVTVSTELLKNVISKYNENVVVLPNYLDDRIWDFKSPVMKAQDDVITIGYMGGHSHKPDIEYLVPVIQDLLNKYPSKIKIHFWGVEPPADLASNPQVGHTPYTYYSYRNFAEFFQTQSADIFIAPLLGNLFNRCKSPLKYFEYSALGVPGVYSRLETYTGVVSHGENGLLAYSVDEWRDSLVQLIEDDELRFELATNAQDSIREKWLLSKNSSRWLQAFKNLTKKNLRQDHIQEMLDSINVQLQEKEQSVGIEASLLDTKLESLSDQVAQHETSIQAYRDQVSVRDEQLQELHQQMDRDNQHLQELLGQLKSKDTRLEGLESQIKDQVALVEDLESQIVERDQIVQQQQAHIVHRERELRDLQAQIVDREHDVRELQTHISERENEVQKLVHRITDRDEKILGLQSQFDARDEQLLITQMKVTELDENVRSLRLQIAEKNNQVILLDSQVRDLHEQIISSRERGLDLEKERQELEYQLHEIYISKVWRVAILLRNFRVWLAPPGSLRAQWARSLVNVVRFPFRLKKELRIAGELRLIRRSGLFDKKWYLERNPDVAAARINPLRHFLLHGGQEDRDPGPNFSTQEYKKSLVVGQLGMNPLIHYLRNSEAADKLSYESTPHSLNFKYYISQIFLIWRHYGFREVLRRVAKKLGIVSKRKIIQESESRPVSDPDKNFYESFTQVYAAARNNDGSDYIPLSDEEISSEDYPVKLIAFYLPQYHPIPENDRWWGKGFTEWTNVTKAVPKFLGHYQPRLPGELGFYDLRLPEIQYRQVDLAKKYGIFGFCFYYYWFDGKRLLEHPLDQFANDSRIDFPFCLCWANENWTRRWDGYDQDILIEQTHSSDTDYRFIQDIAPYLKHRNYIRVDGRPLLIVYRGDILESPNKTVAKWREYAIEGGIGDPYLVLAQVFGCRDIDPRSMGFDAAVEFPPNTLPIREISDQLNFLSSDFSGKVFDYPGLIDVMSNRKANYPLFKTVMPSWDNTARRDDRGSIFISSPSLYEDWLHLVVQNSLDVVEDSHRFVFINAWNEWAEAAYLEPDQRYGYAYLEATSRVLKSTQPVPDLKDSSDDFLILFISHDANLGGAQFVLLNILRWLKAHTFIRLKVLSLDGGELLTEFQKVADTKVYAFENVSIEERTNAIEEFCGRNPDLIYANTAVASKVYQWLSHLDVPILSHLHEMQSSIVRYAGKWIKDLFKYSDKYIACSLPVKENLTSRYGVSESDCRVIYSFIQPEEKKPFTHEQKIESRIQLGLKPDDILIMGCGIGMPFRKGADLFIDVARRLRTKSVEGWHFYWIGDFNLKETDPDLGSWGDYITQMREDELEDRITFLGVQDDVRAILRSGDIFALTSREDPFPLVMMEAAECGLPVIGFADAGGVTEFVRSDAGFVVPFGDCEAFADRIIELIEKESLRKETGLQGRQRVLEELTLDMIAPQILSYSREIAGKLPAVSVIVPNYNHARYLPKRLESIFNQSFRDFEVILMDDKSTDDSLDVLKQYDNYPDVRIEINQENSGSAFRQWLKGIEMARAPIIWIAESDDWCETNFLSNLLPAFNDESVNLAYCASKVVDENDKVMGDYRQMDYLTSLSPTRWNHSYSVPAEDEINAGLGIKNVILNMSAVLFRKFEFSTANAETFLDMRIGGDWYFILNSIKGGKVSFDSSCMNYHRRHPESVIGKILTKKQKNDLRNFYREYEMNTKFVVGNFLLDQDFLQKWQAYQEKLWQELSVGLPQSELEQYFPLGEMEAFIQERSSSNQ